jgi:hypothetical protein
MAVADFLLGGAGLRQRLIFQEGDEAVKLAINFSTRSMTAWVASTGDTSAGSAWTIL